MRKRFGWSVPALLMGASACGWWDAGLETRTFRVDNLQPFQVEQLLAPYVYTDRVGGRPGTMSVAVGAVTVRETADNLEKIARVLEEFDVPAADSRLRFQLIRADGAAAAPDPAIASVVIELEKIFRFRGYELLGEAFVTVGDGDISQAFPGTSYVVTAEARPLQRGLVRLQSLNLWDAERSPILSTSVTVPVDQTLVLGSAPSAEGEGAVILTVRAEQPEAPGG